LRIVINSAHQRFGGCIQVVLSFINECRNFPQHEYYIWAGDGLSKLVDPADFPDNFHFQFFSFGRITIWKTFSINRLLKLEEQRVKPDVIIATGGPTYFRSVAPQVIGYNLPLYIYEESPFVQQLSLYRQVRRLIKKRFHFYFFKRDASYFVVQTDDVNQRIRKALNTDRVQTVSNTASSYYREKKSYPAKLPRKEDGVFRFVTISSYYPHKNLELIPQVLKELNRRGLQVEFVLTLKPADFEKHIGTQPGIHNVGPVKPEECPSLYRECDGMFLPTLAECFSASYPEAMIMEKPIVTTDLGFARSICGEAALYFKPKKAESAADQIEQLIHNKTLRQALIRNGQMRLNSFHNPQERAAAYLARCEMLALR